MKICTSASVNSLDATVDPRFGRCPYFIIVDSETMKFETIPNLASGPWVGLEAKVVGDHSVHG